MTSGLGLGLLALALVDSTSVGTLVVPVWLLLAPRRTPMARIVLYLGAIATFYLAVGVVLLLVVGAGLAAAPDLASSPAALGAQLALGVGLFALCWRYDSGRRRRRGEPDRVVRWRHRVLDRDQSPKAVLGLALGAGTVELLTMLPYLAALGLLVTADLTTPARTGLVAAYCLVMVAPAAVLAGLRAALRDRLDPLLRRCDAFAARHADSAVGWLMGIVGFLLARDAAVRLWWPGLS